MSVPEHAVHFLEIVTPDVQAAAEFYAQAYGWQFGFAGGREVTREGVQALAAGLAPKAYRPY